MARQIVLLRGINLGAHNRVAMPALREALEAAGMDQVRTYVQSGNIVLDSDLPEAELITAVEGVLVGSFDLNVAVLVRSSEDLAAVVAANPLADVVTDPKRYQVSFLSGEPSPEVVERLRDLAAEPERLVVRGRELYAWHPEGVARSKLWNALAARGGLGDVAATARNWTTVTTLLEMSTDNAD
jgi:uncharacterized protein (DUF1697 family)